MRNQRSHYIKNSFFPCVGLSAASGVITAILITAFKCAAEWVIKLSVLIYGAVRDNPLWFPCLLSGAAAIGLLAGFILSLFKSCRGGGIPTSVVAIRGITAFEWLASIIVLPFSALLTFFCGIPLGTEGPCVQMGTAVGDGVVQVLGGNKHKAWRRYIMTGGASSGFALATGAPVTALIFSVEELQKRFSPLLLTIASISVMTSQITARIFSFFGIGSTQLFHITELTPIPIKLIFTPLIVGIVCGVASILFIHFYNRIDKLMSRTFQKVSLKIKFPIIFVLVGIIGFLSSKILGTGHSLIDNLLSTQTLWYILIVILLLRAVLMMVSNIAGITGGIFLPTLAFGAIIGAICAEIFMAIGLVEAEYYALFVVLGMTAFLGATSRIPVTSCVFAIEALGGINNCLAIILTVTAALLIVEVSGLEDFTDSVIKTKLNNISQDKEPIVFEARITVCKNSFVIGKSSQDILWPYSLEVIALEKTSGHNGKTEFEESDVITVRYQTYNPSATAEELRALVGEQSEDVKQIMSTV